MFETSGTVNNKILKEFSKRLFSVKNKIIFSVAVVTFMVLSLMSFIISKTVISLIFFGASLLTIGLYFGLIALFYKIMVKKFEKIDINKEVNYKVSFNDNGATINNLITGNSVNIKYSDIKRKIEMSTVVAIFAKDYRYFFVFKDCFNSKEKQEFDKFISEKCKMLK